MWPADLYYLKFHFVLRLWTDFFYLKHERFPRWNMDTVSWRTFVCVAKVREIVLWECLYGSDSVNVIPFLLSFQRVMENRITQASGCNLLAPLLKLLEQNCPSGSSLSVLGILDDKKERDCFYVIKTCREVKSLVSLERRRPCASYG